jgi:Cu/Ag efflux pump CusA
MRLGIAAAIPPATAPTRVRADVAIKVFGDDLERLHEIGRSIGGVVMGSRARRT